MSFHGLLNGRCSWYRRDNTGQNDYGEITWTETLIASDVRCSRQTGAGNNMRQLIENKQAGNFNSKLVRYYIGVTDIQEGDRLIYEGISDAYVRDVRDAAGRGHHMELIVEEVVPIGEGDHYNG